LYPESDGPDKILERTPERFVIVNNRNEGSAWHRMFFVLSPISILLSSFPKDGCGSWKSIGEQFYLQADGPPRKTFSPGFAFQGF
jgi:hypothetical protein